MKKYIAAIIVGIAISASSVHAQDAGAQDAGDVSATEVINKINDREGEPSNAKLIAELKDVKVAYEKLKNRKEENLSFWLTIAGLVGAVLKFLVDGLKRVRGMTKRGTRWIPWVLVVGGPLSAFLIHYASGASLVPALTVGFGGPMAVLFNELGKVRKKSE